MSRRRRAQARLPRALVTVLVAGSLSLLAAPTTTPAHAEERPERAVPTCNGLVPTDEGEPGGTVIGTAGDDVIVTHGAARVDTGAGNDSICVTGRGTVVVNAGLGDDFVGARSHIGKSVVSLGFGDDVFLGGKGDDRVWSQEASNQSSPDDHDEIETGDGDDYVISGSSTATNNDTVLLGPGDDALVTYGAADGATLLGGPGTNMLQPLPGNDVAGDWLIDNVHGGATLDGFFQLAWVSFQRFDLNGLHGPRVRFLGSRASEWVTAGGTCRVVLRGRDGDDRLTVDGEGCNSQPAGDAVLSGGPGDDLLTGAAGDDILRGGSGQDRADGGLGTDRCSSATPVSCSPSGA